MTARMKDVSQLTDQLLNLSSQSSGGAAVEQVIEGILSTLATACHRRGPLHLSISYMQDDCYTCG